MRSPVDGVNALGYFFAPFNHPPAEPGQHSFLGSRPFPPAGFATVTARVMPPSSEASHSASVISSLLRKQQIHCPASANVRASKAKMIEQGSLSTGFFEGIGEDGQTVGVKLA
jgi:hypothetical protein